MNRFLIAVSILFFTNITFGQDKHIQKVSEILMLQQKAWNTGDIAEFMKYYWKSDNLQFISDGKVIKGWDATLERYYKTYPSTEIMGQLTFTILETTKRGNKVITLAGKFHLEREMGNADGYFLLIWQKIKGKWVIVADQTCSLVNI
jgi:ketosteroid isomerase-like protein